MHAKLLVTISEKSAQFLRSQLAARFTASRVLECLYHASRMALEPILDQVPDAREAAGDNS